MAGNSVGRPPNTPELLGVDVQHLPGFFMLVAHDRLGRRRNGGFGRRNRLGLRPRNDRIASLHRHRRLIRAQQRLNRHVGFCKLPPVDKIRELREPMIVANILLPPDYVGPVMKLCLEKRGVQKKLLYLGNQVSMQWEVNVDLP